MDGQQAISGQSYTVEGRTAQEHNFDPKFHRERAIVQPRAKGKRTPPDIEPHLRRYNAQGITNWNEILKCLQKENPAVHIKRSTLGEYLKECGLGTSRRNKMTEEDMRKLVMSELSKPESRKRGPRTVWRTIKSQGNHIKRGFIEKIMKEVNPEGFFERAPKWKVASNVHENSTSRGLATIFPEPSLRLPQMADHRNAFPDVFPPQVPLSAGSSIQESIATILFQYSPATTDLLDQAHAMEPSFECASSLCLEELPENVTPQEERANDFRVNFSEQHADDGDSRISGSIRRRSTLKDNTVQIEAGHVRLPPSEIVTAAFQNDVDAIDYTSDTQSEGTIIDDFELDDWEEEFCPLDPCAPPPGFWDAMSKASQEEQDIQMNRLQLKNAVWDLLVPLEGWYAALSEDIRQGTPSSPVDPLSIPSHDRDTENRKYVPDYSIPQNQVTKEAHTLSLKLQHVLLRPKSSSEIFEISDLLWEICGRLRDTGMPEALLGRITIKHLKILTILEHICGRQEWVMWELWMCAADYLQHVHQFCSFATGRAAKIAADAADELHTTHHHDSSLRRAISLHYSWFKETDLQDDLTKDVGPLHVSLELFRCALDSDPSQLCAQEMLRTLNTTTRWSNNLPRDAAFWRTFYRTSSIVADPDLTTLYSRRIPRDIYMRNQESHEDHLPLGAFWTTAVTILRSFQHHRPSRFMPALARLLDARFRGPWEEYLVEILIETITIQQGWARFGQPEALECCLMLATSSLSVQLSAHQTRWDFACDNTNHAVEILHSFPFIPSRAHTADIIYPEIFTRIADSLECHHESSTLATAINVANSSRPFLAFYQTFRSIINLMLAISDTQQKSGDFKSAVETSREAVSLSRPGGGTGYLEEEKRLMFPITLCCHARCLIIDDSKTAKIYLEEAQSLVSELGLDESHYLVRRFAIENPSQTRVMEFDERDIVYHENSHRWHKSHTPTWLRASFEDLVGAAASFETYAGNDERAWGLLLFAIQYTPTSREQAKNSAAKSLVAMERYSKWCTKINVAPSVFASILGLKYILAVISWEVIGSEHTLQEMIAFYHIVLTTEPHMARLPVVIFLDLLLKLSHTLRFLHFATPVLEQWKRDVFQGSTFLPNDLVPFLEILPLFVYANSAFCLKE